MKTHLNPETKYLSKHIFYGLTNLNTGFDAPGIFYFSQPDFQIVLQRAKENGIGITGIEAWKGREFYDVLTYEAYTNNPTDAGWYMSAFEEFKRRGEELQYTAGYYIP